MWQLPRGVVLLLPLVVAAPFSLLRDISSFAATSAFGVFANTFVVVVLCCTHELLQPRTTGRG